MGGGRSWTGWSATLTTNPTSWAGCATADPPQQSPHLQGFQVPPDRHHRHAELLGQPVRLDLALGVQQLHDLLPPGQRFPTSAPPHPLRHILEPMKGRPDLFTRHRPVASTAALPSPNAR